MGRFANDALGRGNCECTPAVTTSPADLRTSLARVRGDRAVAERGLAALVAQVTDSPTSPTFGTVGELCDKWWTYSSPNLSPTVAREYRRLIDRRVVPRLGYVKVIDLRAHDLDGWYSELLASGAVSGGPLSANSVRHIHSVLHRALEQGIAWDWIAHNPARRATRHRRVDHAFTCPAPTRSHASLPRRTRSTGACQSSCAWRR